MGNDSSSDFHIAIAGGGAAGLSLAWHLANSSKNFGKIALIDERFRQSYNKTWCFWDHGTVLKPEIVHHQWSNLSVLDHDFNYTTPLEQHRYYCTKNDVYNDALFTDIRESGKFEFFETRLTGIRKANKKAKILTRDRIITADTAFQSFLLPSDDALYKSGRVALKQHFVGWEIETINPIFDQETAILMDFRVSQKHGFAFVYILPFSNTQALVEVTYFTPNLLPEHVYNSELKTYLKSNWNLAEPEIDYAIRHREQGVIPMVDGFVSETNSDPIFSIGAAGGLTKASTGYTFSRIQRDSARILKSLEGGKRVSRAPLSPYRFRYYDLLMLQILKNKPANGVHIFKQLFERNGFDAILSFLDEKTTFPEELRIMSTVPSYADFFKSILKTGGRSIKLNR